MPHLVLFHAAVRVDVLVQVVGLVLVGDQEHEHELLVDVLRSKYTTGMEDDQEGRAIVSPVYACVIHPKSLPRLQTPQQTSNHTTTLARL